MASNFLHKALGANDVQRIYADADLLQINGRIYLAVCPAQKGGGRQLVRIVRNGYAKRPAKPIAVRVCVELAGLEPASGQAIKMLSTCLAGSLIFVRKQGSSTQPESYPLECLCFYGALEQIASDL